LLIKYLSLEYISYVIKCMQKQINKYYCLSKMNDCTHWHINPSKLLLCLCVVFDSSFVCTRVCVFLHIQSPLRECRSIRSGASGLPHYCAPLVCVSDVMELLAVWWHNKPKNKKQRRCGSHGAVRFGQALLGFLITAHHLYVKIAFIIARKEIM